MTFKLPTEQDFDWVSDDKIAHRDTKATFSRYPGPTESTEMRFNRKKAGDGIPDGEEYWEAIYKAARKMLFPKE
jgi:hypothetical protein